MQYPFFLILVFLSWSALVCAEESSSAFVGTYNVHNLSSSEELASDLAKLPFVDIWGFQEVMFKGKQPDPAFMRILPQNMFVVARPISLKDRENAIWEGHAIASRFPIETAGVLTLEPALEQSRAALYAIIQIQGRRLLFVNTDHDIDHFRVGYHERLRNLTSLIEGIHSLDFSGPMVLVGDFNTADSYPNWRRGISGEDEVRLTQNFLRRDGWSFAATGEEEAFTFATFGILQQLDHIFSKGPIQLIPWRRLQSRSGSDHFPIYSELIWGQPQPNPPRKPYSSGGVSSD